MLSLAQLQEQMREAVVAVPGRTLLDEIVSDRISARQRIRIYRNHFRVALKQCLAVTFPATRILLGERYFDAMSGMFISLRPPQDPRLREYGGEFPRFLAARDELEITPFVAHVARLEWSLTKVTNAADPAALDLVAWEQAMEDWQGNFSLRLCPSALLFDCDWSVHLVRRAALKGEDAEMISDLIDHAPPARLLVYRDADRDTSELALDETGFSIVCALHAGRRVSDVLHTASHAVSGYPAVELVEFLFRAGLVAGLSPTQVSDRTSNRRSAPCTHCTTP